MFKSFKVIFIIWTSLECLTFKAFSSGNSILFYFTISKSYFINYTIPFYNTLNIPNSIFFATLFKYSFLFFFYYFSYSSSSSLPPSSSKQLATTSSLPPPLTSWQTTDHRPVTTTTTTTTIVHANHQNPHTQPPTQKPTQQLADLETHTDLHHQKPTRTHRSI